MKDQNYHWNCAGERCEPKDGSQWASPSKPDLHDKVSQMQENSSGFKNFSSAGLRAVRENEILRRQHRSGGLNLRSEMVGRPFGKGFLDNGVSSLRRGFLVDRV